ncbi:MAG: hypothetical protein KA479_05255 [Saprospiraceae bacterium]|jgi:hypothetical protein|nr:hypothetical protein [Saprospiraceae bacterium]
MHDKINAYNFVITNEHRIYNPRTERNEKTTTPIAVTQKPAFVPAGSLSYSIGYKVKPFFF